MKKVILISLLLISITATMLSLIYSITGSMEEFPASEQHEKVRLVFVPVSILLLLVDVTLVKILKG